MKKLLLSLFIICSGFICGVRANAVVALPMSDTVHKGSDVVMPQCSYDMTEYLKKNMRYPEKCKRKKIDGRVVVGFVVDEDGTISNVTVVKGVHKLLDKEAIRVIASMPAWTPGQKNRVPVKVNYKLPVVFKLK